VNRNEEQTMTIAKKEQTVFCAELKIETAIQKRLLYFSTGCLTACVTGW